MKTRIFVLDDETNILRAVQGLLQTNDYNVSTSNNPVTGLKTIIKNPPDLLLLDVRMPGMDGFEVLKELRRSASTKSLPVIILSVQAAETDVVLGLEMGADDYVQKPFRERELLSRIKASLRRREEQAEKSTLSAGPIHLDLMRFRAEVDGETLDLRPKEFQLLALFLKKEGFVLTRSTIAQEVWQTDHIPTSRTIDTFVDYLRKKLGRYRVWIKTLKGIGYRFEMDE